MGTAPGLLQKGNQQAGLFSDRFSDDTRVPPSVLAMAFVELVPTADIAPPQNTGCREQELSRVCVQSAGLRGQLRAPDCVSKAIIFLNMFKVILNRL